MQKTSKILIGSVQVTFCGLRFRSNRFKHSVKRFGRFGLDTLLSCTDLTYVKQIDYQKCFVLQLISTILDKVVDQ